MGMVCIYSSYNRLMCTPPDRIVEINGMKFRDVTNETCGSSGRIYNYEEAVAKSQGREIYTGHCERKEKL